MSIKTISDAIKYDHAKINAYYEKYSSAVDVTDKKTLSTGFIREIARHSIAEELIAHPLYARFAAASDRAKALKDEKEHHDLNKLLSQLLDLDPGTPAHGTHFKEVVRILRTHFKEEEADLTLLEANISVTESGEAANNFLKTRQWPVPNPDKIFTSQGHLQAKDGLKEFLKVKTQVSTGKVQTRTARN